MVDGGLLKLRDGITLSWDDVPVRPILINVSDGTQSAAFLLHIAATEPISEPGRPTRRRPCSPPAKRARVSSSPAPAKP